MPQRCLEFVEIKRGVIIRWLPNTACTRRVGVAAFSSSFRGSSQFRQSGVLSSRPPAGNAHRWGAIRRIRDRLFAGKEITAAS